MAPRSAEQERELAAVLHAASSVSAALARPTWCSSPLLELAAAKHIANLAEHCASPEKRTLLRSKRLQSALRSALAVAVPALATLLRPAAPPASAALAVQAASNLSSCSFVSFDAPASLAASLSAYVAARPSDAAAVLALAGMLAGRFERRLEWAAPAAAACVEALRSGVAVSSHLSLAASFASTCSGREMLLAADRASSLPSLLLALLGHADHATQALRTAAALCETNAFADALAASMTDVQIQALCLSVPCIDSLTLLAHLAPRLPSHSHAAPCVRWAEAHRPLLQSALRSDNCLAARRAASSLLLLAEPELGSSPLTAEAASGAVLAGLLQPRSPHLLECLFAAASAGYESCWEALGALLPFAPAPTFIRHLSAWLGEAAKQLVRTGSGSGILSISEASQAISAAAGMFLLTVLLTTPHRPIVPCGVSCMVVLDGSPCQLLLYATSSLVNAEAGMAPLPALLARAQAAAVAVCVREAQNGHARRAELHAALLFLLACNPSPFRRTSADTVGEEARQALQALIQASYLPSRLCHLTMLALSHACGHVGCGTPLGEALGRVLESSNASDVELCLAEGGESVLAHSAVLSLRCPGLLAGQQGCIRLGASVTRPLLTALLCWAYTGTVSLFPPGLVDARLLAALARAAGASDLTRLLCGALPAPVSPLPRPVLLHHDIMKLLDSAVADGTPGIVMLCSGEAALPCHALLCHAWSDYFSAALRRKSGDETPILRLDELESHSLHLLRDWLYRGAFPTPLLPELAPHFRLASLLRLCSAADMLLMPLLAAHAAEACRDALSCAQADAEESLRCAREAAVAGHGELAGSAALAAAREYSTLLSSGALESVEPEVAEAVRLAHLHLRTAATY